MQTATQTGTYQPEPSGQSYVETSTVATAVIFFVIGFAFALAAVRVSTPNYGIVTQRQ